MVACSGVTAWGSGYPFRQADVESLESENGRCCGNEPRVYKGLKNETGVIQPVNGDTVMIQWWSNGHTSGWCVWRQVQVT